MHPTYDVIRGILIIVVFAGLALWLVVHSVGNAEFPKRMAIKWVFTLPLVALIMSKIAAMPSQPPTEKKLGMTASPYS